MPRLNNGNEVFKYVTSVEKFSVPSVGAASTTASAALAAAATAVGVASAVGIGDQDYVQIAGDGGTELVQVNGAPAGNSLTSFYKLAFAQSAGAQIQRLVRAALGHLDESGVTFTGKLNLSPVYAATSRVAIAYIGSQGELGASFKLRGFNLLNLQTVFGVPEAETGTGTAADPFQVGIGSAQIGSDALLNYRMRGVRTDLRNVMLDFCGATVEVNVNTSLGGSNAGTLDVGFKYTNLIARIW